MVAMGAGVLYTAHTPKAGAVGDWRDLPDLIAEVDILSLHVPLTDETAGMIDAPAIARMKPGAVLINTARRGLVDEAAMVAALAEGRLAGAGLAAVAEEPPPRDHPLFAFDSVILAPHLAWLTAETLDRSLVVAVENRRRLAAGDELLRRVA